MCARIAVKRKNGEARILRSFSRILSLTLCAVFCETVLFFSISSRDSSWDEVPPKLDQEDFPLLARILRVYSILVFVTRLGGGALGEIYLLGISEEPQGAVRFYLKHAFQAGAHRCDRDCPPQGTQFSGLQETPGAFPPPPLPPFEPRRVRALPSSHLLPQARVSFQPPTPPWRSTAENWFSIYFVRPFTTCFTSSRADDFPPEKEHRLPPFPSFPAPFSPPPSSAASSSRADDFSSEQEPSFAPVPSSPAPFSPRPSSAASSSTEAPVPQESTVRKVLRRVVGFLHSSLTLDRRALADRERDGEESILRKRILWAAFTVLSINSMLTLPQRLLLNCLSSFLGERIGSLLEYYPGLFLLSHILSSIFLGGCPTC